MKKVNVEMSFPEIYRISQLVEKQIKQANRNGSLLWRAECYELQSRLLYALHKAEISDRDQRLLDAQIEKAESDRDLEDTHVNS
tara:strand:- start:109 stop:360 length:252 start_codon:yes stop_codon:yes gene_type:complete